MAFTHKIELQYIICIILTINGLAVDNLYAATGPEEGLTFVPIETVSDTIPLVDRQGDFISDETYNPFDILPTELEQNVEYDAETDTYVVYEKIGDEYYRTPTYMTFSEYLEWKNKKAEERYFGKLAGLNDRYDRSATGRLDPMSKVNIEKNLIDRLFGGNGITITPQGSIDLGFGARYNKLEDPTLQIEQQRRWIVPDFDMDIKMNVDGKIGDKMDLGFNYDPNASFDFDRKIKLAYDSEKWTDDDIIKKVEAGNVSLPLRTTLIQGAQELFGLKTELQFGNLTLTGIISQQKSEQEQIRIENGATIQEFEIRPNEYDENRHFFLSHYHRAVYEKTLENLPNINNGFRITNIEVWVSDDRPNFQSDQTMICALADIAEPDPNFIQTEANIDFNNDGSVIAKTTDINGRRLPDNIVNDIYERVVNDPMANTIDNTTRTLEGSGFNLVDGKDFGTFRGRKLTSNEFYFNPELGFISLNVRLRPNQNLAVAYEYFYTNNCEDIYKVGSTTDEGSVPNSDANGEPRAEGVIFTKMLKPVDPDVNHQTWDLMMKNVYPLRANNLTATDFEFDIYYEDDLDGSLKKVLPIDGLRNLPLLNIFGLDKLNTRNDPQPDGIFDFVPGVTVVPQSSSIVFPVLEPFGDALETAILDRIDPNIPDAEKNLIIDNFVFHELYDTSVVIAELDLAANKFVMAGKVKSSQSSEYSLGAWNIPQGSVTVTAGSVQLVEGVHYEVDYGIGRVRIIDQALIQQGVPINISFEDNSIFSLQQKYMMGLRAEYEINENFYVGGTFMRLRERPFTQKVNIGDDPISNKIFGLDMDFSQETPFITKLVDKLPFYSTNTPSTINFSAEVAAIKPGHNSAINDDLNNKDDGGIVSLDDFEGAVSGFPLSSQPNRWVLASLPEIDDPERFPENAFRDDTILAGVNRAKLAWYVIDRFVNIDPDTKNENAFTRRINQTDLYNRQIDQGQLPDLLTFDLTYFPEERGPYNYDLPEGYTQNGQRISEGISGIIDDQYLQLESPETRWAGIMRYLSNNDFQAANYEFIDFWMLNPFGDRPDGPHMAQDSGYLSFHLGNVSEDILPDGQQFYENAIAKDGDIVPENETAWGKVPQNIPINDAFPGTDFQAQDIGLDGLDNVEEREKYFQWREAIQGTIGVPATLDNDIAGDDFQFFNDQSLTGNDLLQRYKNNNNPEGNSPDISGNSRDNFQRGNPFPDKEDMNNNRSLDQIESFWEYRVPIRMNTDGRIDTTYDETNKFIRDRKTFTSSAGREDWYRFRIPLDEGQSINGISGFRSIQFIRMIVEDFKDQTTFRLADFELVRNQWRKQKTQCVLDGSESQPIFSTDIVGIEENQEKLPFGYAIPPGIKQERLQSTFAPINQDENSMVLKFEELKSNVEELQSCNISVTKLTELDLRVYEKMQMFIHAERNLGDETLDDNELAAFLRVGKDFERHFYEYSLPLTVSDTTGFGSSCDGFCLWPEENMMDFPLDLFIQAKKIRNVIGASVTQPFVLDNAFIEEKADSLCAIYGSIFCSGDTTDQEDRLYLPPGHSVTIIGNPNLGRVKGLNVGVRNISDDIQQGEVWINELRLTGLLERGGVAGIARMDIQLADLGGVSASASYNGIGFGALDQKVNERSKEETIEYDVATNLALGKFFPENWGIEIPFYAQYAKTIVNPEFDAYDFDITVDDEYDLLQNAPIEAQADIPQRNQQVNTIKTFNFTNVRKNPSKKSAAKKAKEKSRNVSRNTSGKVGDGLGKTKKDRKPMPWNISNFSASYAYTEKVYRDPILEKDNSLDQTLGLDYNYSSRGKYIEPFKKKIKSKNLKILKEFNFNLFPNSIGFNSSINRYFSSRKYRLPETPVLEFDDKRFTWERRYDLNWNFTKALKLNFSAFNESYIDEARQIGIAATAEDRKWEAFQDNGNGFLVATDVTNQVEQDADFTKDYWKDNLRNGGRNTAYDHSIGLSYKVPIKYLPYLDWMDVTANYRSSFAWSAGALIRDAFDFPLTGVIQNSQDRSVTANLSFDKLYNKSKYLKNLDKRGKTRERKKRGQSKDKVTVSKNADGKRVARKKARTPGTVEKLLIRPLFALRSARLNYKENFKTVVPGYTRAPEYFGLDSWDAPGVGFILGLQPDINRSNPDNYLDKAANNGWITESPVLNQEVIQEAGQTFDAQIKIEPWRDFKLTLDFKKNHRTMHSEVFKNFPEDKIEVIDGDTVRTPAGFNSLAGRDMGSFDMTFYNANTLWGYSIDSLFNRFTDYRSIISGRLNPGGAPHDKDGTDYKDGYGKQSSAVVIPAFMAAYTNKDPESVNLDLEARVARRTYIPKPNWNLRYDGLSKIPWFKDRFQSFTIEHGYSSLLRVSNFNTDVQFDGLFTEKRLNGNYYTRVEIPAIQISESFNPLIGLKMKTKNDFTLEFEYNKSRDLNLKINTSSQLEEDKKETFVFGVGYTIKDSKFLQKKKGRGTRSRTRKKDDDEDEDKKKNSRGRVTSSRGSDMTFMLNFAYNDNGFFVHQIDKQVQTEDNEVRGEKGFQINPTVDYILNDNITLRAFFDYNMSTPYGISNFPRTNIAGGINVRMTLK